MYLKSVITTRRVLKMIFLKNFGEPAAFKVDYICSKIERQQLASKKKKKKKTCTGLSPESSPEHCTKHCVLQFHNKDITTKTMTSFVVPVLMYSKQQLDRQYFSETPPIQK